MDPHLRRQLAKLVPSFFLLLAEIVVAIVVALTLGPTTRGFVTWDATLDHPYQPDSSIPLWTAVFVPLVSLLAAIAFRNRSNLRGAITQGELAWLMFFVSSGITTAIVTEVLKNLVGRYRPDWLDRCTPADPGEIYIDSFGATSAENPACLNDNISASKLNDGKKSFPSGHSSTAFCLGTVVVCHAGWWMTRSPQMSAIRATALELWMALQISWAFGVASSRVMDNKHHVGDVVAGGLLGVLFGAMYSFRATIESSDFEEQSSDPGQEAPGDQRCILHSNN